MYGYFGPLSAQPAVSWGLGERKHSKDIDDTVLLPLRCSQHILEDMMYVHAHNFRTLIFIHKHYSTYYMLGARRTKIEDIVPNKSTHKHKRL